MKSNILQKIRSAYKGGELIPNLQGSFANPPRLQRLIYKRKLKASWRMKTKRVPYVPSADVSTNSVCIQ